MSRALRLAIVGCGAIVEYGYLVAARAVAGLDVTALVDIDMARAERLARQFAVPTVLTDLRRLPQDVGGVLIAVPHHLHAPMAVECLQRGLAVLVEKPLALTAAGAQEVVETARRQGVVLQAAQTYRFCRGAQAVKRVLEDGWLGSLQSVHVEGNFADTLPLASGFCWNREHAGGGILMDVGTLVLDLLAWWLGKLDVVEYYDDSLGGVEAECDLRLVARRPEGSVPVRVRMSRLRPLHDWVVLRGRQFSLRYGLQAKQGEVQLQVGDDGEYAFALDGGRQSTLDLFAEQLRSFKAAAAAGEPVSDAEAAVRVLELIETCYGRRRSLGYPWLPAGLLALAGR
ncbi:MAG: Gfo/Idh/MocA family oxidoreductase [Armatimonadota bacterium]|nr:Gfo/Idh/MocA family oxidoreductase [Armatimonadota bacterium]